MRKFWLLIALLSTTSLAAENLGNLVYNLPDSAKTWGIYKQTESKTTVNVAYAPKDGSQTNPTQSFVVSLTTQPLSISDEATIETSLKKNLPASASVKVTNLDKGAGEMNYEWTITQDNKEVAHGLTRAFSLRSGGTALIQYITENPSDIDNAKAIWLPVIKDAKIDLNASKNNDDNGAVPPGGTITPPSAAAPAQPNAASAAVAPQPTQVNTAAPQVQDSLK